MATYRIPKTFYEDHVDRDLPAGVIVKELSKSLDVELDAAAYSELLSDARYYETQGTAVFGPEFVGLISSARATAKRLTEIGPPA